MPVSTRPMTTPLPLLAWDSTSAVRWIWPYQGAESPGATVAAMTGPAQSSAPAETPRTQKRRMCRPRGDYSQDEHAGRGL